MYVIAAIAHAIGRVTTHDNKIPFIIDLSITSLSSHFLLLKYCLNSHIPNIAHRAIWVDDTGNHNADAKRTVAAADRATQNALIWSNFVISFQTVLISLAPNIDNHNDRNTAPIIIIQNGTQAALTISAQPFLIVSLIAASGHIAFATSFDQCAKESRATAKIKGTLNNVFINSLSSLKNDFLCFLYITISIIYDATQISNHKNIAFVGFIILCKNSFELKTGFNHFSNK